MFTPGMEETVSEPETDRAVGASELDHALEVFQSERTRLFRIAYRVIGDVSSAEDVVQEAWLRWQRTDRSGVRNPAAFLTTTTTRLSINVIQSAHHRHELPAETPTADAVDPAPDPAEHAERSAAVETALGLVMARLAPTELAAYLLRMVFDYPYGEIARLLRTTMVNSRQLVRRARPRLAGELEREVDPTMHRHLVTAFLTAARTGDMQHLEAELVHGRTRASTGRHLEHVFAAGA
jgi:RNA polymerase sigma factor (sigma-70 family)